MRDDVTSATAITTAAIPAYSVGIRCSPSSIAPRITATTGFTYAYVATLATGTCSSSHTNAVYPTREPKVTRYATAPTAPRVQCDAPQPPTVNPTTELEIPAASICHPAATIGFTGNFSSRDRIEPTAHKNDTHSTMTHPTTCWCCPSTCCRKAGHNKAMRPIKPSPRPIHPRDCNLSPRGSSMLSTAT